MKLQEAKSYVDAELAWASFLTAVATIYSKLEQGAKANGKSMAWYGRQRGMRRKDPLLRYLQFARNNDEHGLEYGTYRNVPTVGQHSIPEEYFGQNIPGKSRSFDPVTQQPYGPEIDITIAGPNIVLRRVTDSRYGTSCDPPTEHLGKPIEPATVQHIAVLGLVYVKEMLEEAHSLKPAP